MGRRSHTHVLGLWMNGAFVGTWTFQPQGFETLHYDAGWATSPQGRPLSLSLPFTPDNAPHQGHAVHAWFDNLLPDSQNIRERIARRYGTASVSAFDLLAEIGRDCVGALQILPEGIRPAETTSIQASPLSEAEIAQLLRDTLAPATVGAEDDDFRISIAGAQEKTALLRLDGQWSRPHGTTPTSHILKLPLGLVGNMRLDLSDSIENEWLCTEILAAYGMPVARCEPLRFEDMNVLAVERFDRRWWRPDNDAPQLIRLPQEDLCQATRTPPHLKYEADGGPGMDTIMALLKTSARPEQDVRTFFQAQVLFWMLCAPDGHAKNFSLSLRPGGAYALTPLYDVLSAYPVLGEGPGRISPHRVKMAMAVRSQNPHWRMRDIRRRHWLAAGRRHGVVSANGGDVRSVVDDLIARTPGVLNTVQARLPRDFPSALAECILNGLRDAADRLAD